MECNDRVVAIWCIVNGNALHNYLGGLVLIKESLGNGIVTRVPDIEGRKEGEEKTFDQQKRLMSSAFWKNGRLDGPQRFYYTSGELYHEVFFTNGVPTGEEKWYYKNGTTRSTVEPCQPKGFSRIRAWDNEGILVYDQIVPPKKGMDVVRSNLGNPLNSTAGKVLVNVTATFSYLPENSDKCISESRDTGFSVDLRNKLLTINRSFSLRMPMPEIVSILKENIRVANAVMNFEFQTIRYMGITIPIKYIYAPETIPVEAILQESNVAKRRLLLEMCGYGVFLSRVEHEVIDTDGDMSLVRVHWHNSERSLYLLKVKCASTGVFYTLRVPPQMKKCRDAVSWTFGLKPEEYTLEEES